MALVQTVAIESEVPVAPTRWTDLRLEKVRREWRIAACPVSYKPSSWASSILRSRSSFSYSLRSRLVQNNTSRALSLSALQIRLLDLVSKLFLRRPPFSEPAPSFLITAKISRRSSNLITSLRYSRKGEISDMEVILSASRINASLASGKQFSHIINDA